MKKQRVLRLLLVGLLTFVGLLFGGELAYAADTTDSPTLDIYGPIWQDKENSFTTRPDIDKDTNPVTGTLDSIKLESNVEVSDATTFGNIMEKKYSIEEVKDSLIQPSWLTNGLVVASDDYYEGTSIFKSSFADGTMSYSMSMDDLGDSLNEKVKSYPDDPSHSHYYVILKGQPNRYKSSVTVDKINEDGQKTELLNKIGSSPDKTAQYILLSDYFDSDKSMVDTDTGQLVDVTPAKLSGSSFYTFPVDLSRSSSAFTILPTKNLKKATINYKLPDGSEAAPSAKLNGYEGLKVPVTSPEVAGYTPDQAKMTVDFKDTTSTYTVNYKARSTTGTPDMVESNTTAADTNSFTPFKVYGKQTLYTYKMATFKKSQRVNRYVQKAKAYAPVFQVVGIQRSNNGVLRYKLSNDTYITANADYVGRLYWQRSYPKMYVTNAKGINTYDGTVFSRSTKQEHFKQGKVLRVVKSIKSGQTTRYELADGTYITGDKQWVTPNKPQKVNKLRTKRNIKLYKDVDFTRKVKTIKAGKTLKVNGWDYSHGYDHTAYGTLRYRVNGGYVTANSKFIEVAKY